MAELRWVTGWRRSRPSRPAGGTTHRTLTVAVVRQDDHLVRLLRQRPAVEAAADLPAREAGAAQQQGHLLLVHPADLNLRAVHLRHSPFRVEELGLVGRVLDLLDA